MGRLWLILIAEALRTAIPGKEPRTQKYDVAMHPMVFTTETTSAVRSRTLYNLRHTRGTPRWASRSWIINLKIRPCGIKMRAKRKPAATRNKPLRRDRL